MNTTAMIIPSDALAPIPGCVATLCTTVSQDQPGGDVEILDEASSVALTDSPRGLAWLLPGGLRHGERTIVSDELAAFVNREQRGAFVLERLLLGGDGRAVHIEVRILPIDEYERRDLAELLGDQCDPDIGRDLAALYAADVEATWVERAGGTLLPVCFLEELNPRGTANRAITVPLQHIA